jgi:hypothetical protein
LLLDFKHSRVAQDMVFNAAHALCTVHCGQTHLRLQVTCVAQHHEEASGTGVTTASLIVPISSCTFVPAILTVDDVLGVDVVHAPRNVNEHCDHKVLQAGNPGMCIGTWAQQPVRTALDLPMSCPSKCGPQYITGPTYHVRALGGRVMQDVGTCRPGPTHHSSGQPGSSHKMHREVIISHVPQALSNLWHTSGARQKTPHCHCH